MRALLVGLSLALVAPAAFATSIRQVVEAFTMQEDATHSANDWTSVLALKDVQWHHEGFVETPVAPMAKTGHLESPELGRVDVHFSGARTMVFGLDLNVGEAEGKIFEKEEFDQVLHSTLGDGVTLEKLRGGCDEDGEISGSAVYAVSLPGRKPVFVYISTDAGGNSPDSRSSSMQFSLKREDRWSC